MTNTFQTNSFTSGMNMDVDVNLIKDNQYRYAENVRIITNDNGTTGALQGIEELENTMVILLMMK